MNSDRETDGDEEPPLKKRRARVLGPSPTPSLYQLLSSPSRLLAPLTNLSHQQKRKRETEKLERLAKVFQVGPAVDALRTHLENEAKRLHVAALSKRRHAAPVAETDGRVPRTKSIERLLSQDLNHDETEAQEAGDEFSDARLARRNRSKPRSQRKLPKIPRPIVPQLEDITVDFPEDFSSGPLLCSLHAHISDRLASSYNVLAALTPLSPVQPPDVLAHFDALHAAQAAEEAGLAEHTTRASWHRATKHWRAENHLNKSAQRIVGRQREWRNADRAFEDSALVAIGILLQLQAEDLLQHPDRPAVPSPSPQPNPARKFAEKEQGPESSPPLPDLRPLPEALTRHNGRRVLIGDDEMEQEDENGHSP